MGKPTWPGGGPNGQPEKSKFTQKNSGRGGPVPCQGGPLAGQGAPCRPRRRGPPTRPRGAPCQAKGAPSQAKGGPLAGHAEWAPSSFYGEKILFSGNFFPLDAGRPKCMAPYCFITFFHKLVWHIRVIFGYRLTTVEVQNIRFVLDPYLFYYKR